MRLITSFVALAALAATSVPCLADVIDGNWCNEKTGQSMQIEGPMIVTPGGTRIEGRYSRHAFFYTVPEREAGAGTAVHMQLLDENDVRVQVGEETAIVWKRCEHTS